MTRNPSLDIEVEPAVLQWAIGTSGWTHTDLIKKLKINHTTYQQWLSGRRNPSLRQLEVLSKTVKRPLAAFFLSQPPTEPPLPTDYRQLPEKEGKFDKTTILAIRRARRLQHISSDLAENLNIPLRSVVTFTTQSEDQKKLAEHYRNDFVFTDETQKKMKNAYDLFSFIRTALEKKNILVFQIPMLLEDARGLTLVDNTPEVVVVNSKDQIEARVFTLLHEFGHVLLHESGVSMPERTLSIRRARPVEKWCNEFASAFLLPDSVATAEFQDHRNTLTDPSTLSKLSRRYKVSKSMLLYNMYKHRFITQTDYEQILDQFSSKALKPTSGGFAARTTDQRILQEKGQKFVSLVATNLEQGLITSSDALEYLSIKSHHLEKVLNRVKK
jgi:Zn-dependent peptidase ImmA (M78 family)